MVPVTAGVEGGVVINPIISGGLTVGKLTGLHLSDNDGTRINEGLDCRSSGVSNRVRFIVSAVATASFDTLDIIDILNTETNLWVNK